MTKAFARRLRFCSLVSALSPFSQPPRDRPIGSVNLRYADGEVDCDFPGRRGTQSGILFIDLCGSKG
jgi:hypothetical protein